MKQKKCPRCQSLLDASNDMRCVRFPICLYQEKTNLDLDTYILYDLETTGFSTKSAHIIEIGALYVEDGIVTETFSALCNPGEFINQRITQVTGITNEQLKDARPESEVVKEFVEWIKNTNTDVCVGQNVIRFDNRILETATKRFKLDYPFKRTLDTLMLAQSLHLKEDGKVSSYKQEALAEYYGIEYSAHRAVNDAEALFEIFKNLKEGVDTLPISNI